MTILPSRMATAGLNVPAASQPLPRGAITGASDNRCQAPNGKGLPPCAARAVSNAKSANILDEKRSMSVTRVAAADSKKRQGRPPAAFAIRRVCFKLLLVDRFLEFGP